MRVKPNRNASTAMAIACWWIVSIGQTFAAEPRCSASLMLEADSIQSGEALDVSLILQVKNQQGGRSFLNPFFSDKYPIFARIQVLGEDGEVISVLLTPATLYPQSPPPKAAWQWFGNGTLVGRRFMFTAEDQRPATEFLKQPGRYRIQVQILHQMLGWTLYNEQGELVQDRIPQEWPCDNSTSVAIESDSVPFSVIPNHMNQPDTPREKADISPLGLRLRIARRIRDELPQDKGVFFWVLNTSDKPRILNGVLRYNNPYALPLNWSYRDSTGAWRTESDSSLGIGNGLRLGNGRAPNHHDVAFVEVPPDGICGASSKAPHNIPNSVPTELFAEINASMLSSPWTQEIIDELLTSGHLTKEGIKNCEKLKNTDIIATSNRLSW